MQAGKVPSSKCSRSSYSIQQHCVKSDQIRSFSGPYFLVFGLNTEIYSVNLRISPITGKYGPGKTPHLDTFHVVQN